MSITMTISVIGGDEPKSQVFLNLLFRLRKRSIEGRSRRYEIVSGEENENYRNIAPIHDLNQVERLLGPKGTILVEFGFGLRSGRSMSVTLCYSGPEFWGSSVTENGPITLLFSLNDIARPLYDSGGIEQDDALRNPVLTAACVRDAEDLFLTACGVSEGGEVSSGVKHGIMYADYGFVSPLGCAMIYHEDASQVLTDFPRIYCAYHFGTNPIIALNADSPLWNLAPIGAENDLPGRLKHDLYRNIHEPDGEDVIGFLNGLEAAPISRLRTITEKRIQEWFRHADLARWQIYYHELPNGSFALTTYPLFTLWRAYADFYDQMKGMSLAC